MKKVLVFLFFFPSLLQATTLLEAVNAARRYDAGFSAALQEKKAGNEAFDQGLAGLLPSINLEGSYAKQDQPDVNYAAAVRRHNYSVNLNQPLFDLAKFAAFQRGSALSDLADAEFIVAQQTLISEVSDAFFKVVYQREALEVAVSASRVYGRQREQALAALRLGEGTRTEVDEAQANFDEAQAEEIAARNDLEIAGTAYTRITGLIAEGIEPVSGECYRLTRQKNMKQALLLAQHNNAEIRKASTQVAQARSSVVSATAAHLPVVTLQASYGGNWSRGADENVLDNIFGTTSKTKNTLVGINVSLPLFAGGGQLSASRETLDRLNQAKYLLENTRRKVNQQTRAAWLNITNGSALLKARQKATLSADSKVKSTRYGRELGLRTTIDELNAEQKYYDAMQSVAEARYKYLIAGIQLLALQGTLDDTILQQFNCQTSPNQSTDRK